MKSFLLIAFCVLTTSSFNAQISPFQKTFGSAANESLWRVVPHQDGSYMTLGNIFENNVIDIIYSKINSDGEILYTKKLSSPIHVALNDILTLDDGSIIITGRNRPYTNASYIDNTVVYRMTDDGSVIWGKQFGNETVELFSFESIITSDNAILMSGFINDVNTGIGNATIMKLDNNGVVIFQKQWNASIGRDLFSTITETADGYIAAGYSDYADPNGTIENPIVAKFDFDGNLIWSFLYDDGSQVNNNNISVLPLDGGNSIVAYRAGTAVSSSGTDQDIIVMKLNNEDGTVIWSNRYGSNDYDNILEMSFSHEGNIIINGEVNNNGYEGNNGLILVINSDGEILKANLYGNDGDDRIGEVIAITDENDCQGYFMVGSTSSFNSASESTNAWILKTDANFGDFGDSFIENITFTVSPTSMQTTMLGVLSDWNQTSTPNISSDDVSYSSNAIDCNPIQSSECIVNINTISKTIEIKVYPNPNTGDFLIETPKKRLIKNITIIDITGKEIPFESYYIGYSKKSIVIDSNYSGIIILSLETENSMFSKRLIIN